MQFRERELVDIRGATTRSDYSNMREQCLRVLRRVYTAAKVN
jgi:hypothetical protein